MMLAKAQSLELPEFMWFALKASLMCALQALGAKLLFEVLFGSGFPAPLFAPLNLGDLELTLGILSMSLFTVGVLMVLFDTVVAIRYWGDREKLCEKSLSLRGDKSFDMRMNLAFRFFFIQSFGFMMALASIQMCQEDYGKKHKHG